MTPEFPEETEREFIPVGNSTRICRGDVYGELWMWTEAGLVPVDTFVWETRAEAGITDPPRQPVCGGGWPSSLDGLSELLTADSPAWDGKNYSTYSTLDKS